MSINLTTYRVEMLTGGVAVCLLSHRMEGKKGKKKSTAFFFNLDLDFTESRDSREVARQFFCMPLSPLGIYMRVFEQSR